MSFKLHIPTDLLQILTNFADPSTELLKLADLYFINPLFLVFCHVSQQKARVLHHFLVQATSCH